MNGLVFDIGGTNIRIGVAKSNRLGRFRVCPIPKNYRQAIQLIHKQAEMLAGGKKINGVAGGVPGILNKDKSKLIQSTHLKKWIGKPIVADLEKIFSVRTVLLRNDCECIALGEANHGAGKGYKIVAYIGFGTGIGGSRVVNGKLDHNAFGYAPGDQLLNYDVQHLQHVTPHAGDWESLVSGAAIRLRYGVSAETIHSKKIWREMEHRASLGLINVSALWSPHIIVLGGSMMKSMSVARIRDEHTKEILHIFSSSPKITKAQLGDFGGLYGAMELLKRRKYIQ